MEKLFKLNLQLFADEPPVEEEIPNPQEGDKTPLAEEKKFTQADLDKHIKERLSKATKGQLSKEELDNYNKWQESKKTEEERRVELDKQRDDEISTYKSQVESYERKSKLVTKVTDPEHIDFISFEVGKLVTPEKSFDEALAEYEIAKPHYFGIQTKKPLSTGKPHSGGSQARTEFGFEDILRKQGKLK